MTEFPSTRLRLQQQLRRQRQMQQEQRNPYSAGPYSAGEGGGGNTLPPRQEQAQPDSTSSEAQQRHSANQ
jgi:hypothetical protein